MATLEQKVKELITTEKRKEGLEKVRTEIANLKKVEQQLLNGELDFIALKLELNSGSVEVRKAGQEGIYTMTEKVEQLSADLDDIPAVKESEIVKKDIANLELKNYARINDVAKKNIEKMYASGDFKHRDIADIYGISTKMVSDITRKSNVKPKGGIKRTRLNYIEVENIKEQIKKGVPNAIIAKQYDTTEMAIKNIGKGKTYQPRKRSKIHQLSESNLKMIRNLYASGKHTQKEIGDVYGIAQTEVSKIIRTGGK